MFILITLPLSICVEPPEELMLIQLTYPLTLTAYLEPSYLLIPLLQQVKTH